MVDDMKGGKVMKSGKIMTLIFLFLTSLCIRADQLTWIDRARIVYDNENYGEFCFWAEKSTDKPLFVLNALAAVYLTGKGGVQTNSEKAVSFLNDAIKFWDKEGLSEEDRKILLESTVRLGDCYRRGIGVGKIDALKAEEMFKKAADQKSARGCYELGSCYEENIVPGVSDNLASATNWYFKAMSLGHGPAATNAYERVVKRIKDRVMGDKIIWFYDTDKKRWGNDENQLIQLNKIAKLVKDGPKLYAYIKGFMDGEGKSVVSRLHQLSIVVKLLDLGVAAEKIVCSVQVEDVVLSEFNLGGMTELTVEDKIPTRTSIKGSRLVVASAADWRKEFIIAKSMDLYESRKYKEFMKHVELNEMILADNPLIPFLMAQCFELGRDVAKNERTAFKWYLKSAKNGLAVSQARVSALYRRGIGTDVNYEKAFYWALKSASQNYAVGCFCLGVCYEKGVGTDKDFNQAVKNYQKAAKLGNNSAKVRLQALGLWIE